MVSVFKNEAYIDFGKQENQRRMRDALEEVSAQLGQEYDIIIGSQRVKTAQKFSSYNPSEKDQVVGIFQKATPQEAEAAIQ
ncbi:L-glutamate gamma-semialdehyde dehydrogenase, partial [bacterium]|nr:L-glutamate gamma-semialdehyde dehydrogenase [bacterium]